MPSNALCSVAVFHDGTYVQRAQLHYYQQDPHWLELGKLQEFIINKVREHETTYERHSITYSAWFQGISTDENSDPDYLKRDRRLQRDLMKFGIHPTFLPLASRPKEGEYEQTEKGVDVALAISALEVTFANRLDFVALVTGDADFVPLVWSLKRRGVRVGVFGFRVKGQGEQYMASALCNAAHLSVDIESLRNTDEESFRRLFGARKRGGDRAGGGGERDEDE